MTKEIVLMMDQSLSYLSIASLTEVVLLCEPFVKSPHQSLVIYALSFKEIQFQFLTVSAQLGS